MLILSVYCLTHYFYFFQQFVNQAICLTFFCKLCAIVLKSLSKKMSKNCVQKILTHFSYIWELIIYSFHLADNEMNNVCLHIKL